MATTYTPGTYQAEVVGQGFGASRIKGTPCFTIQFRVVGRYDGQGGVQECPTFERTADQYLATETGAAILRGDLSALGVEVTQLTQLEPGTPGHVSLVGRTIDVTCEHEVYQGRVRERWRVHRPRAKLDLESVRDLDARFGHVFSRPAPASAAPPPTPPGDAASP
jgi:hypothetical protein